MLAEVGARGTRELVDGMSEKLKPCPFCGGEAHIERGAVLWAVVCGCASHVFYGCEQSKERTAMAWNTRAEPITLMSPITVVAGEPQTYVPLRTCHATKVDPFTWGCSECGGHWHDAVTYCPWCGAKVVE